MALLWDICNSSWCYSESIFKIYLFEEITLIHSSTFYHIGLFQLCQRLVVLRFRHQSYFFPHGLFYLWMSNYSGCNDLICKSATLTQGSTHCQQCGQSPVYVELWFKNFAMPGAQHSKHVAGNVVWYYFKIRSRSAVTMIAH